MEIDWLEDFLALSTAGVFAKAAHNRRVSQSAFTRRIKNLEHWVGTPLFDRSVHPVVLTSAGEAFRATACQTINTLRQIREELKQHSNSEGEALRFSVLHTLSISFVPAWIKGISKSIGPIKTNFIVDNFSDCVETLTAGNVDFMLSYDHPSMAALTKDAWYPSITVSDDCLVAVSRADTDGGALFHFGQEGKLPLLSYPYESFLGRLSWAVIEESGLADKLETQSENSVAEAQKAACLEGLGVAWLPEMAIRSHLDDGSLVRISDARSEHHMSIKLFRNMERSRPAVEQFWKMVQNSCAACSFAKEAS
ncbi:MAG: LysR family transcriptional regulator [Roseibium sp.]|uniref:LysR family transcriptional regulator n=1 Tax=Roseibium sp. TaxID=1936156 RepID=UPI0026349240|nr:LysR family transcriptional regulator [Roseibium sp.]MCV0426295.1 LysR family transcriptional regulator [Roseibium sp.]